MSSEEINKIESVFKEELAALGELNCPLQSGAGFRNKLIQLLSEFRCRRHMGQVVPVLASVATFSEFTPEKQTKELIKLQESLPTTTIEQTAIEQFKKASNVTNIIQNTEKALNTLNKNTASLVHLIIKLAEGARMTNTSNIWSTIMPYNESEIDICLDDHYKVTINTKMSNGSFVSQYIILLRSIEGEQSYESKQLEPTPNLIREYISLWINNYKENHIAFVREVQKMQMDSFLFEQTGPILWYVKKTNTLQPIKSTSKQLMLFQQSMAQHLLVESIKGFFEAKTQQVPGVPNTRVSNARAPNARAPNATNATNATIFQVGFINVSKVSNASNVDGVFLQVTYTDNLYKIFECMMDNTSIRFVPTPQYLHSTFTLTESQDNANLINTVSKHISEQYTLGGENIDEVIEFFQNTFGRGGTGNRKFSPTSETFSSKINGVNKARKIWLDRQGKKYVKIKTQDGTFQMRKLRV
jgi:hypothetical protein